MKEKIKQAIIDNLEAQASASTAWFASHSPDEIGYDGSINVKNLAEAVMLMIGRVDEAEKEPEPSWQSGFEAGERDARSRAYGRPGDGDMGG